MNHDILTDEERDYNDSDTQILDEKSTVGEPYEEKFMREVATLPEKAEKTTTKVHSRRS